MKKTVIAVVVVVVIVVAAAIVWWAIDRQADDKQTSKGSCGGGSYEFSTETDGDNIEVSFELQSTSPGETWTIVIDQEGKTVFEGDVQTDDDAELDVDIDAKKSDGETFTVEATPEAGDACDDTITA